MNVTVEIMPSYSIACFRQTGPYGVTNFDVMEKLKAWAGSNDLLNDDSIILGIAWDNPKTTPEENCRYDACLSLSKDDLVQKRQDMHHYTLSGGKYAVFKVPHTIEAVQSAWAEIFPALRQRGFQVDAERRVVERYQAKMVADHLCEICVPILS